MKKGLNIWDSTKSILAIIIVGVCLYNINAFTAFLNKPGVDEASLTRIAENVMKVQMSENRKEFKEMLSLLKDTNSLALQVAKNNNERLDELGRVTSSLSASRKLNTSSEHTYTKGKEYDHFFTKIYRTDPDGKEYPVAWAMFQPNKPEGKRWKTGAYPLKFFTNVVETEQDDGKYNRYVEINLTGPGNKESRDKFFKVKVEDIKWAKNPKTDKSFMFNPRLSFGGFIGSSDIYPGIDLSLFSYGKTKRDMLFRFLVLGAGGNEEKFYGNLRPIEYNIGTLLPVVENFFAGPSWTISSGLEKPVFGVNFSVPF
jgi:hypothetical protein